MYYEISHVNTYKTPVYSEHSKLIPYHCPEKGITWLWTYASGFFHCCIISHVLSMYHLLSSLQGPSLEHAPILLQAHTVRLRDCSVCCSVDRNSENPSHDSWSWFCTGKVLWLVPPTHTSQTCAPVIWVPAVIVSHGVNLDKASWCSKKIKTTAAHNKQKVPILDLFCVNTS